jgi:hypothetical protein
MSDEITELRSHLARLEQAVRELSERVRVLERSSGPRAEHPSDQATVRQKVTYDWQS